MNLTDPRLSLATIRPAAILEVVVRQGSARTIKFAHEQRSEDDDATLSQFRNSRQCGICSRGFNCHRCAGT